MGDENNRHAELALQFAQQQQDLDLHGGIERRGRLVRQQNLRLAGQRQRDHRALAHAAGHLVRKGVEPALGRGNPHHFQHFQRARHRLRLALALVTHHGFRDLLADGVNRIERQRRLLEDHRHGLAAKCRQFLVIERQHIAPQHLDASRDLRALLRQQPHQRAQGDALAGTGLAEQAEHLALTEDKAEIVDGMHGALAGEANVEIADFDQIAHAGFGTRAWKSVARWNAAPIRNSMASSNERPINCIPTGRPLFVKPDGIASAGSPR